MPNRPSRDRSSAPPRHTDDDGFDDDALRPPLFRQLAHRCLHRRALQTLCCDPRNHHPSPFAFVPNQGQPRKRAFPCGWYEQLPAHTESRLPNIASRTATKTPEIGETIHRCHHRQTCHRPHRVSHKNVPRRFPRSAPAHVSIDQQRPQPHHTVIPTLRCLPRGKLPQRLAQGRPPAREDPPTVAR